MPLVLWESEVFHQTGYCFSKIRIPEMASAEVYVGIQGKWSRPICWSLSDPSGQMSSNWLSFEPT